MLPHDFLGGVVEGFYGQPWTHAQRLRLFADLNEWGLNTYFYAPKDDLKHRAIWRELYNAEELAPFRELVQSCEEWGIHFIYGLSPGLNIRFSDAAEREFIAARFDQLWSIGVRHFALLFDDLPGQMSEADRRAYPMLAAAQCDVVNAIFAWLRARGADSRLLFCPTPYCDRMDRAQLGGVGYLDEIGKLLSPEIDIFWTGPDIVSEEIPLESIARLSQRIGRLPVIWDNLFASDYDFRRCHCGPYAGRSHELRDAVRGILVNPNNEFPINFIPLRTFVEFLHGKGPWAPREAFLRCAAQWHESFATVGAPIELDDLILLADCFYLPHAEGTSAQPLLALVERLLSKPVGAWGDAHEKFRELNLRIQGLFERLTELRDRELFYAWSRRAWELKEELQVIDVILALKKAGRDLADGISLEDHLPGTYQGGLIAKLRRLLELGADGNVRPRTL